MRACRTNLASSGELGRPLVGAQACERTDHIRLVQRQDLNKHAAPVLLRHQACANQPRQPKHQHLCTNGSPLSALPMIICLSLSSTTTTTTRLVRRPGKHQPAKHDRLANTLEARRGRTLDAPVQICRQSAACAANSRVIRPLPMLALSASNSLLLDHSALVCFDKLIYLNLSILHLFISLLHFT